MTGTEGLDSLAIASASALQVPIVAVGTTDGARTILHAAHGVSSGQAAHFSSLVDAAGGHQGPTELSEKGHPAWSRHPMVVGAPGLRFCFATPLPHLKGSLVIADTSPREAQPHQIELLSHYARIASEQIRLSAELDEATGLFRTMLEACPVSVRLEDFSAVKAGIDALGIERTSDFVAYLDRNPDFVASMGQKIRLVDTNSVTLGIHGYQDKQEFLQSALESLSEDGMRALRRGLIAIHRGDESLQFETTVHRRDGEVRRVLSRWSIPERHRSDYQRTLLASTDITYLRRTEEMLRHSQRLEAVGKIAGGVAHDFNNLLTVVKGNAELLEEDLGKEEPLLQAILHASRRGAELTQHLLAFSRQQPLKPQSVDLRQLLSKLGTMLGPTLGETIRVAMRLGADENASLYVDQGQLEASLLNLAINARDAMPSGGTLEFVLEPVLIEEVRAEVPDGLNAGSYILLRVTDTGTGMSADVLNKAVEPFFTTKDVGRGSGLGLSMVYGFAKQSGGHFALESEVGRGTTAKLYLPRSAPSSATASHASSPDPQGGRESILLVEDDPDVRAFLERALQSLGYQVTQAANVGDARRILARDGRLDLVLTDMTLGGGEGGLQLAEEIRMRRPQLPTVFITGHAVSHASLPAGSAVLQKPFSVAEMASILRSKLDVPS